ncbi:MAG: BatD family protein [Deltaproteobacteria bacterium]
MKSILTIFSVLIILNIISAQKGDFTMEVSNDTVLEGNYFILKYRIMNVEGKFEAPDFSDFQIVGGPMSNSMFSMVNGKTSRESSYTYLLKPIGKGTLTIPKARLIIGDESLYTGEIKIVSKENPEGIKIKPELKDEKNPIFIDHDIMNDEMRKRDKNEEIRKKFNIRKL